MSRMNSAWSSSEQWKEAVPEIFKQPMTIAFGGAILAHALFFLGLPAIAGKENPPDVQPVNVVELTPQDKAQIPSDGDAQSQFPLSGSLMPSTSGLINPTLTSPPLSTPPLSTPAPIGSTSVAPNSDFSFGIPSNPSFSSSGYSGDTFGNSSSIDSNTQLEALRKKLADAQKEADKKTEAKQLAEADAKSATKPPSVLPPVNANAMPPGPQPQQPIPNQQQTLPSQQQAPLNQQQSTPNQQQVPLKRPSDPEIIAAKPEFYAFSSKQTGPTIGFGVQQIIGNWYSRPDSKEREIYSSLQKPPEVLQVDTKTKKLPYPVQVNNQPVAVIPDYAKKVDEGKETNGQAIVGIAIDGQGKFASEPSIIQSTGYPILDAYAIEYVKSRMFRVTGRSQLYIMVIPIEPPVNKPTA